MLQWSEWPGGEVFGNGAGAGEEFGRRGVIGVEQDAGKGTVKVVIGVVVGIPGELGAEGDGVEGGGRHVEVTVIAPIRVEQAGGAFLATGAGIGGKHGSRFLDGRKHAAEPADRRADHGFEAPRGEFAAFLEAVGREVGPIEHFAISGESIEGLGIMEEHVSPQHQGFSVAGGFPADKPDVVDVLPGEIGGRGVGHAFAEIMGFVAA